MIAQLFVLFASLSVSSAAQFAIGSVYPSSDCSGTALYQYATQCNECYINSATSSIYYSCTDDCSTVTTSSYSSTNCQGTPVTDSLTLDTCGSNGVYLNGVPAYTEFQCQSPTSPEFDYFGFAQYSSDADCSSDPPLHFFFIEEGVCLGNEGTSTMYVESVEKSYSDIACGTLTSTTDPVATCSFSSTDGYYSTGSFGSPSDDDDDDDACSSSPCPTSCPALYTASHAYSMDGCTVYCADLPVNGQCLAGGSGCSSSCSLAGGLVAAIVIAGLIFIGAIAGGVYVFKYGWCCGNSGAMASKENEMSRG